MNKKIISALMAAAMCISALPVTAYAKDTTAAIEETTIEYSEFTQKLHDEIMLDPEESETNRLIYTYAKALYDTRVASSIYCGNDYLTQSNFFGVEKTGQTFIIYYIEEQNIEEQNIGQLELFSKNMIEYYDNPYITEEEFSSLSTEEKLAAAGKIYEETGKLLNLRTTREVYCMVHTFYCDAEGKGYEIAIDDENEIDIVDGKIVPVYDTMDNADVLSTENIAGDANEDGKVSISDAVLIMQALANPDEFALTEQGALNADYNGDGSVTAADALAIQMIDIS